jgi:hypothetical protein
MRDAPAAAAPICDAAEFDAPISMPSLPLYGTFSPVFEDKASITSGQGWYHHHDGVVWASIDITWDNDALNLHDFPVRVRLPFKPATEFLQSAVGPARLRPPGVDVPVFLRPRDFELTDPPAAVVTNLDVVTGAAVVVGSEGSASGDQVVLTYGDAPQRAVLSLTYVTTGEPQYPELF